MWKSKMFFFISLAMLITTSLWESCARLRHGLSLRYSESDRLYSLTAYYDRSQTWIVESYINRCTEPDRLFHSENDRIDAWTKLNDHTAFKIKSSPGELEIELDKRENSRQSYYRIKQMCEGIKNELLKSNSHQ